MTRPLRQDRPSSLFTKLIISGNPVVDFLMRMKMLEAADLKPRDLLVLYVVVSKPGISRSDVAHTLGLNAEVNVKSALNRLINVGFVEDRRKQYQRLVSADLHATKAGIDFWQSIKP